MIKGFDISRHQGKIDWDTIGLQKEYKFCFIRIGYRGYSSGKISKDEYFDHNLDGVKKIGMPHGFYFFSGAINKEEVRQEANYVIACLKGHSCDYPVVYDYEGYQDPEKRMHVTTQKDRTEFYLIFKKIMNENGYRTMIYESQSNIRNTYNLDLLTDKIWCARYAGGYKTIIDDFKNKPEIGRYTDRVAIWQYTSIGKIPGIDGNVDLNFLYEGFNYCDKNPFVEPKITLFSGNVFQTKEDIKWLQWHLKRLKYYPSTKPIDGKFDILTQGGFKIFQKHHPETYNTAHPDGKCGKLSRRALNLEV